MSQQSPISLPVEPELTRATVHAHIVCSKVVLDRVNTKWQGEGKRPIGRRPQRLKWRATNQSSQRWSMELEFHAEEESGDDTLILTLTGERVGSRTGAIRASKSVREVQSLLDALTSEELEATSSCFLHWQMTEEEIALPFRLPFDPPFPTSNEIQSVTGFRACSPDGSVWVIVDRELGEESEIHVGCGFTYEVAIDRSILERITTRGSSLIGQVVDRRRTER